MSTVSVIDPSPHSPSTMHKSASISALEIIDSDKHTSKPINTPQITRKRPRYNEAALLCTSRQLNTVGMSVRLFSGCIGLLNLGNTCYLNSVIQALAYADEFKEYYLQPTDNNTVQQTLLQRQNSTPRKLFRSTSINDGTDLLISKHLSELYQAIWATTPAFPVYEPTNFLYTVWSFYDRFTAGRQHDAHEFCTFLLNQCVKEYKYNHTDSVNVIEQMFACSLRNEIKCHRGHISYTDTNFIGILSLHLPPFSYIQHVNGSTVHKLLGGHSVKQPQHRALNSMSRTSSRRGHHTYSHQLDTCLKYMYNNNEELTNDNKFMCNKCNKHVDATRRTVLTKLPDKYLILHIVRTVFDASSKNTKKDQSHVTFPIDGLDMTPYMEHTDNQQYIYDLFAVVSHHGRGVHEGHYDTYAWHELHDSWLHYNDSSVSLAEESDVLNTQPYLLFYKRRPTTKLRSPRNITKPVRSSPRIAQRNSMECERIVL